jgi:ribokinase
MHKSTCSSQDGSQRAELAACRFGKFNTWSGLNTVESTSGRNGRVLVVGSLNMDLVVRASRLPLPGETLAGRSFATVPGGKGGNQAVAAARLGASVAMIGCIGADANGEQLLAGLRAEQIDCAGVSTSRDESTGIALIVVDDGSQNAIVIIAGSNGALDVDVCKTHEALFAACGVVVCQLEVPAPTVRAALALGRRLGKITVLNPAPVSSPLSGDWLGAADYLIPNEIEAAALTGMTVDTPERAERAAAMLRGQGARNVLITLGAQGVFALTDAGATLFPAPRVEAVDTTAAGDTFVGGFCAALAGGEPFDAAVRFGQAAAAVSVTRAGAQPSIPYYKEIHAR